ncbi:TPA: hypothetical protein HA265_04045 [Candidatus Woesearchaeota archaeon]|nr:hypothetical protein [Candidatus Woesearchaeota archaeon]
MLGIEYLKDEQSRIEIFLTAQEVETLESSTLAGLILKAGKAHRKLSVCLHTQDESEEEARIEREGRGYHIILPHDFYGQLRETGQANTMTYDPDTGHTELVQANRITKELKERIMGRSSLL